MTKRYFHIDRRCFNKDEEILPEGAYHASFPDPGKRMEEVLERERASHIGKPNRASSLFVFDDFHCAESYWRTHDKSYLYEVEIDESAIEHCGDMHLTDAIGAHFRQIGEPDLEKIQQLAKSYWEGEQTSNPCREYLVGKAKTVNKLLNLSDMKTWVRSQVTVGNPADAESVEQFLKSAQQTTG